MKHRFSSIALIVCFVFCGWSNGHAQWVQTTGPSGGTVRAIAVLGTDLFAGLTNCGVFRSTDNGATWKPSSAGLPPNSNIHTLAVSGTTLFAGTDDGIYRSTDHGSHWDSSGAGITLSQ